MPGLLDIAPLTEFVTVGDTKIDVLGVSAKGVAVLLSRFPELREMMTGRQVDADRLMAMGGDAVAAIIAAGVGQPGDEAHEAAAGRLSVEIQADFLAKILKITFPNGIGSFVSKLTALGEVASGGADQSARAQAGKSPPPSRN